MSTKTRVRTCLQCGNSIEHKHVNAKFCSLKHKDRYHNKMNPRGYFAPKKYEEQNDNYVSIEDFE